MAALAWACIAGCALAGLLGSVLPLARVAPLLLLALLAPAWPWRRPRPSTSLAAAAAAGALLALAAVRIESAGCLARISDGARLTLVGHLEAPAVAGRGALRVEDGLGRCRPAMRVLLRAGASPPAPGKPVEVVGRWMASGHGGAWAGALRVGAIEAVPGGRPHVLAAVRGNAVETLYRRFGERGPVAAALVVARTEGLERDLRQAFVRSGTAHLVSISGFHVAVVAALLFTLLRLGGRGVSRRWGAFLATAAVWAYVLGIGAPDAAARAGLMLTLAAFGTALGRPAAAEGTIAVAFLILAVADPSALLRPGTQLSFAGVWGLVRWAPGIEGRLRAWLPGRVADALAAPLAVGCGATLGTLPIVAWHFERVSLVGIPATLVTGPLVALAVPGLLITLAAEALHPAAGAFVAGGVDVLLAVFLRLVDAFAALPFASVPLPRSWSLTLGAGAAATGVILSARRVRRRVRVAVACAGALAAFQLRPVALRLAEAGSIEVVAIDVGQGDALLLRSPRSRWLLVDAGPASDDWDAGRERILPILRARGVDELEAIVLTHPHLDHVGGAAAVIDALDVGGVLDPGWPAAGPSYHAALEASRRTGAGWWPARAGTVHDLDGMRIRVLAPASLDAADEDPNAVSVVLLVSWGAFSILLTGDAPAEVGTRAIADVGPVDVLKVAHHGSSTSTAAAALERLRPSVAIISVGRRNRYGHPHPSVIARLEGVGARVLRTDVHGTISLRARADGSLRVRVDRVAREKPPD